MPDNESATDGSATGGASGGGSVGGGAGGKAVLGGAGQQSDTARPLFVGFIFPSPLDENGNLSEQPLNRGLGPPHLFAAVYAYNTETEGPGRDLHAEVDGVLGRPYFKAYLYPVTENNVDEIPSVGGGAGGKAVLGGAPGAPIYIGQFRATVPATDDSGDGPDSPPNP